MTAAKQQIDVIRILGSRRTADADCAAVEEPLEVRLHGRAFAVIMRTPGADRELAAGFLLSERVITAFDDLGTIAHCTDQPTDQTAQFANVVNVTLTDAAQAERAWVERRQTMTNSSCGLCGRRTIESLSTDVAPVTSAVAVDAATLAALPARLRGVQAVFDDTGGLHAAGLFDVSGGLLDSAEDVGRHNAVDKVIGRRLLADELPLGQSILFVSGRTSFEIVQKALFARIPIVASVSAPSTLAISLAADMGMTLAGFVRGEGFNVYTHAERIVSL
jgi:FdhD protein